MAFGGPFQPSQTQLRTPWGGGEAHRAVMQSSAVGSPCTQCPLRVLTETQNGRGWKGPQGP